MWYSGKLYACWACWCILASSCSHIVWLLPMILWNKDEERLYIWLVMDMLSLVFYFIVALLTMWRYEVLK